jgi:hypothetical protein
MSVSNAILLFNTEDVFIDMGITVIGSVPAVAVNLPGQAPPNGTVVPNFYGLNLGTINENDTVFNGQLSLLSLSVKNFLGFESLSINGNGDIADGTGNVVVNDSLNVTGDVISTTGNIGRFYESYSYVYYPRRYNPTFNTASDDSDGYCYGNYPTKQCLMYAKCTAGDTIINVTSNSAGPVGAPVPDALFFTGVYAGTGDGVMILHEPDVDLTTSDADFVAASSYQIKAICFSPNG